MLLFGLKLWSITFPGMGFFDVRAEDSSWYQGMATFRANTHVKGGKFKVVVPFCSVIALIVGALVPAVKSFHHDTILLSLFNLLLKVNNQ